MFCPNCGTEHNTNACPNCGYIAQGSVYNQPPIQPQVIIQQAQNTGGVKCPRCGSNNLQAISDVKGKGASFWKLCFCGILGLCGTGKTKTEHYWVCGNCGNKFKM